MAFRGYVLDVKTRSKPFHDLLMVPESQWIRKRQKYDFYVGCNEIEEDWVRIWGFINKERLEKEGEWGDFGREKTLHISLKKLNPIIELRDLEPKVSPLQDHTG